MEPGWRFEPQLGDGAPAAASFVAAYCLQEDNDLNARTVRGDLDQMRSLLDRSFAAELKCLVPGPADADDDADGANGAPDDLCFGACVRGPHAVAGRLQ